MWALTAECALMCGSGSVLWLCVCQVAPSTSRSCCGKCGGVIVYLWHALVSLCWLVDSTQLELSSLQLRMYAFSTIHLEDTRERSRQLLNMLREP